MQTPPQEQPIPVKSSHGGLLLVLSAMIAALGSFLFGFDTAVISGTTGTLRQIFHLSDSLLGFTVSIALIGTMVGALGAARPANRWGRRPVLALLGFFFLVSAVGCAFAWNWYALLFFRFLGGVAVGLPGGRRSLGGFCIWILRRHDGPPVRVGLEVPPGNQGRFLGNNENPLGRTLTPGQEVTVPDHMDSGADKTGANLRRFWDGSRHRLSDVARNPSHCAAWHLRMRFTSSIACGFWWAL